MYDTENLTEMVSSISMQLLPLVCWKDRGWRVDELPIRIQQRLDRVERFDGAEKTAELMVASQNPGGMRRRA